MMYAIIEIGGKQHKVSPGEIIEVDRIPEAKKDKLSIADVLLVNDEGQLHIGSPYLKDAKVKADILGFYRGEKTIAYKYRRRKNYRFKKGHRTEMMRLKIEEISLKKE